MPIQVQLNRRARVTSATNQLPVFNERPRPRNSMHCRKRWPTSRCRQPIQPTAFRRRASRLRSRASSNGASPLTMVWRCSSCAERIVAHDPVWNLNTGPVADDVSHKPVAGALQPLRLIHWGESETMAMVERARCPLRRPALSMVVTILIDHHLAVDSMRRGGCVRLFRLSNLVTRLRYGLVLSFTFCAPSCTLSAVLSTILSMALPVDLAASFKSCPASLMSSFAVRSQEVISVRNKRNSIVFMPRDGAGLGPTTFLRENGRYYHSRVANNCTCRAFSTSMGRA